MANPKDKGTTIVIKKIQAAPSGAHGGSWKVAFADFMTAMMCFFLVMWLMGADEEVKKEISHYFNHPNTPYNKGRDPSSEAVNPLGEKMGQGDNIMRGADGGVPDDMVKQPLRDMKDEVEKKIGDITFGLELDTEFDELKFSVLGDEIFEEGATKVKASATKRLDQMAKLFEHHQGQIMIEGHLDQRPMISGDDPYLFSTARAVEVMNYFVKHHKMDPARFCPRGIGSNRAWRATASAGQDSRNRRVEFTISAKNVCSQ
jgi:chemotaxis protein MotB